MPEVLTSEQPQNNSYLVSDSVEVVDDVADTTMGIDIEPSQEGKSDKGLKVALAIAVPVGVGVGVGTGNALKEAQHRRRYSLGAGRLDDLPLQTKYDATYDAIKDTITRNGVKSVYDLDGIVLEGRGDLAGNTFETFQNPGTHKMGVYVYREAPSRSGHGSELRLSDILFDPDDRAMGYGSSGNAGSIRSDGSYRTDSLPKNYKLRKTLSVGNTELYYALQRQKEAAQAAQQVVEDWPQRNRMLDVDTPFGQAESLDDLSFGSDDSFASVQTARRKANSQDTLLDNGWGEDISVDSGKTVIRCKRDAGVSCGKWQSMDDLVTPPARPKLQGSAKLKKFKQGMSVIVGKKAVNAVKTLKEVANASRAWKIASNSLKALPSGPLDVFLIAVDVGVAFGSYIPRWERQTRDESITQIPLFVAEVLTGQDPNGEIQVLNVPGQIALVITESIARNYVTEYRQESLDYCKQFEDVSAEFESPEYAAVRNVLSMTVKEVKEIFPQGVGRIPTEEGAVYVDFRGQLEDVTDVSAEISLDPVFVFSRNSEGNEELVKAGTGKNLISASVQEMHRNILLATAEIATITYFYQEYIYSDPTPLHQYSAGRQGTVYTGSGSLQREWTVARNRRREQRLANYIKGVLDEPSGRIYNNTVTLEQILEEMTDLGVPMPEKGVTYVDESKLGRHRFEFREWKNRQFDTVADSLQTLKTEYSDLPDEDISELSRSITIFPKRVMVKTTEVTESGQPGSGCEKVSRHGCIEKETIIETRQLDTGYLYEGGASHPRHPRWKRAADGSSRAGNSRAGYVSTAFSSLMAALSIGGRGCDDWVRQDRDLCERLLDEDYSVYKNWETAEELAAVKMLTKAALAGKFTVLPSDKVSHVKLDVPSKVLEGLQLHNSVKGNKLNVRLLKPELGINRNRWQLSNKNFWKRVIKNDEVLSVGSSQTINKLAKANQWFSLNCLAEQGKMQKTSYGFFPVTLNCHLAFLMLPQKQLSLLSKEGDHTVKCLQCEPSESEERCSPVFEKMLKGYKNIILEVHETKEYLDVYEGVQWDKESRFYIMYSDQTPRYAYIILPARARQGNLDLEKIPVPVLLRADLSGSVRSDVRRGGDNI